MFKKKTNRPRLMKSGRWRKRNVTIVIAVVLSLFASWTLLAYSGALDPLFRHSGRNAARVAVQSFNSNSPSKEYIYAGGRLVATEEPTSGGGCTAPSAPGNPTATAASSTSVSLSWPASSGTVDHYEVERRNGSGSYALVATVPPASGTVSTTDTNGVSSNTAYLYRVRAFSDQQGSCPSPYSDVDLATTTDFSVDPPAAQGTVIYAVHLLRLKTAVNAVRLTAGQSQFDWGDSSLPVTVDPAIGGAILKDQVQKLRNRLNDARTALGLTPQSYSNEPLTQGTTVYATHILELRQGVQ